MRLAILTLLLAAALSAQSAGIDGMVTNHATGEPLSGVHVRLITGDIFGIDGADQAYGAISDKAGHFSVTGMKPGVYQVLLEHAGFVQAQTAGSPPILALKAGQNLTGHKLEMNPRSIILGRVLDDYGDPVQRVDVEAWPVSPDRGFGPPFFGRSIASTDERGEFQILTAPGKYYVQASPRPLDNDAPPEIRTDGSPSTPYDATYYPNAAGTGSATIVQVAPGQDAAGIEIHLRRSAPPGPVFSVSGVVTGHPDGAQPTVTLRSGENPDWLRDLRTLETGPDGKFSFADVHPAYYYSVFARYSSGKTSLQSQSVDFTIDGSGRTGVQLNLKAGEELTGTLQMSGDSLPGLSAEKRTVYLQPVGSGYLAGNEVPSTETGKAGVFRLANIHPGRFRVDVEPLPENGYIKSVTLDGTPVPDSILEFSRGVSGSKLTVTLGLGAQVSGKVLGSEGAPSDSPLVSVMLWKDENKIPPDQSIRVANNEYGINALLPGKYCIAAIDNLEIGNFTPDSFDEVMKVIKAAAQRIEVKEGDRIVKDLKIIGKEALHVQADK